MPFESRFDAFNLVHAGQSTVENVREYSHGEMESRFGLFDATRDRDVHVFERDVLEAEDATSVVMGDEDTVHTADPNLHAVLEESAANEIVVLSFVLCASTLSNRHGRTDSYSPCNVLS